MNTTKKGNVRQNRCRKAMEQQGWTVYVARRGHRGTKIDIFGVWDIIAHKPEFDKQACRWVGKILLIQVKSNRCDAATRRRVEDFCVDGRIVRKELWIYKDYVRSGPEVINVA